MATKIHQILALQKGIMGQTEGAVTRAYHDAQRTAMMQGLTRVYQPLDVEGEQLPPEKKMVQFTAQDILARAADAWVRQADIIATKDTSNQLARADVIVDGTVLLSDVPVSTLLYLEKTLKNVRELILKLPVLDPEVDWGTGPDPATGLWRSATEETVRTKKIPKAFVKYPATEKHAAQVETFTEDVIIGKWAKTLLSGALPAGRKLELLRRVERLSDSVKLAREYANQTNAVDREIGSTVFDHILAP